MTLRAKLLLAQMPLVIALLLIAVTAAVFTSELGKSSQSILKDNYRSVLAAQRMKESVERMDSAALFAVAGRRDLGAEQALAHRRHFEEELRVQEGNITETGEREATEKLRGLWTRYLREFDMFQARGEGTDLADAYFSRLLPAFVAVKSAADAVLSLNQDAMVRKSEQGKRIAERSRAILLFVSAAGCLLGLFLSTTLTGRLLRPLSVLGQAARSLGEGDLAARALVTGKDEIAQLATEFNAMAERILKYRESSLGELLEAQRAAQATIDSLPDPVLVLAVDGELMHLNRAAESLLKLSMERGGLAGMDPSARATMEKVHHHVASGKGAYVPKGLEEEIRLVTPEGERHFLPRAAPVYADEGNVVGATIVFQDVTRVLRFEELRTNLVATVAHEFRTPLTSLRMAIHLLTEQAVGPLTEKQADLVYAAREDCERLQSTVDELLDLSRIQAGRIELRKRSVEVESLLSEAADAQRSTAAQGRVDLRIELLPGIAQVSADPDRIQLVFANLLTNAIRHSPENGAVTLRAMPSDGWVRFEVSDQGPGIPKEYQQAIFEKYFQLPGGPTGGAGLGLFISKEIVYAHDGDIGVDSEPGKGSTFWFKLPAGSEQKA